MNSKMLIESLGVYLPAKVVSTAEVLRGCRNKLRFPLERVTGIQYRHVAAENEFSVELGRKAVLDCLARSKYAPHEIDLVISCDTSHSTGYLEHSVEPSTAVKLRHELGLSSAIAFDVTNACAGMFTALLIVQTLLQTGAIENALVVSGEHITHLVRTAQLEIDGFRDPRLASLTLGDAGVALVLDRSTAGTAGFEPITLKTLGRYSSLCIGKQTDRSHGGAVLLTDSVKLAKVAIQEAVMQTIAAIRNCGWFPAAFQHCIMHQTAKIAVDEVMRVFNRESGRKVLHPRNTIFNLARRGNTASTTHFVALRDQIIDGRIGAGDRIVFGIAASGVTSGTALYTLDGLPERLRDEKRATRIDPSHVDARSAARPGENGAAGRIRVRVAGLGILPDSSPEPRDSVSMLAAAADACLNAARHSRDEVDLAINAGVYRDDFLCEPAVASIVAGRLQLDGRRTSGGPGTLAFDLTNGSLGTLQACHVAANMIAAGKFRNALVMAAEVEVNRRHCPERQLDLAETASAMLLEASSADGPGFGTFVFQSSTADLHRFAAHSAVAEGRTVLHFERHPEYTRQCLDLIGACFDRLLAVERLARPQIAAVLPPLVSAAFVEQLSERLGLPRERLVQPRPAARDAYTSSLAIGLDLLRQRGGARAGDLAVLIGVGSGIQVGCATYRF